MVQYYVSESPADGMLGSMSAVEIRAGLADGSLRPTFVCRPTEPVGDPNRPWKPLWVVFALSPPGEERWAGKAQRQSGVGQALLTFGQIVSLLTCVAIPVYTVGALSQAAAAQVQGKWAPAPGWIIVGATLAILYSAAMFVVFSRCKRVPPG